MNSVKGRDTRKPLVRLPFAPLAEKIGQVWSLVPAQDPGYDPRYFRRECWQQPEGNPTGLLAELTRFSRRTCVRYAKDGIPDDVADEIAVAIGCHPSEIWPEWVALHDVSLVCQD